MQLKKIIAQFVELFWHRKKKQMSSDFLEGVQDENKTTVLLTYYVDGHASLAITLEGINEQFTEFLLSPDGKGWKNAELIARALNNWIEHTKRINGVTG